MTVAIRDLTARRCRNLSGQRGSGDPGRAEGPRGRSAAIMRAKPHRQLLTPHRRLRSAFWWERPGGKVRASHRPSWEEFMIGESALRVSSRLSSQPQKERGLAFGAGTPPSRGNASLASSQGYGVGGGARMLIKQLLGNVMSGTGHICHTAQRLLTSALPSHPATRDSEARPPKCWSLSERQPPEVPPVSPAPEPGLREALLSEEGNVLPRGPKAGGRKQSQGRKVATFAQSARSLPPDKAAWEVAGSPAASPVQWAAGGEGSYGP